MATKFSRKSLSILIAAIMVMSSLMFATTAIAEGSDENLPIGLQPYDEPVTVTWAVQSTSVQQFFDGDTYEDNLWTRLIKEKLNIDMVLEYSADRTGDAWRNKMNAVMASGELPDVWMFNDRTFFQQAYESGMLADLTDVFDEYATPALKEYMARYPDSFEGASFDGRLYAFPYMNDNFHQAAYLWIRDDWLENLNAEVPTTIDELVALAHRFTYEDPDGNGVDDTYGFALNKRIVYNNYATILGLIGAYGVPGYGFDGAFYRDEDGNMTYAYLNPGMKDALAVVRQLYADGCIDPEFVVKDVDTMETDVINGTIGMTYHMNWGDWHPFNLSFQDSGVITRAYPIPTAEGYEPRMGIQSNMTGDLFMVSSNCENPEAIIKILNLYNQVVYESDDPSNFLKYWSNEQYRLCPAFVGIPTELFAPEILTALEKGSGDELMGVAKQNYTYVVDFESGANRDPNAYGTWGQMNMNTGTMGISLNDYVPNGWLVTNEMASVQPDSYLINGSILETITITAFTDIITGEAPLDSFDQYVQDWLNAGGQQVLDELDVLYPAK